MCQSTPPSPSPLPIRSTSSIKVEINISMNSHAQSRPPALSGIPIIRFSPSVGIMVCSPLCRQDHHLERGYKGAEGRGKAPRWPHHADQVQPHWQPHGHEWPNRHNRSVARHQPLGCLPEGVGNHPLRLLRNNTWRLQRQSGQPVPFRRPLRNCLPRQRHEHVLWCLQSGRHNQGTHVLSKRRLSHCYHFQPTSGSVQNQFHGKISSWKKSETVHFRRTWKPLLNLDRWELAFHLFQLKHDPFLALVSRWELQSHCVWCAQCRQRRH